MAVALLPVWIALFCDASVLLPTPDRRKGRKSAMTGLSDTLSTPKIRIVIGRQGLVVVVHTMCVAGIRTWGMVQI